MAESNPPVIDGASTATVKERAPRPPGLFPRHLQAWFVAGIAGLIVLVVLATGQPTPTRTSPVAQKAPSTTDPNQVRIQEYRDRIEEQVRRLQAEQADLALTKQALAHASPETSSGSGNDTLPAGGDAAAVATQAALQQDEAQRTYRSLYADNLAWSARQKDGGPSTKADAREPARQADTTAPAVATGFPSALTTALVTALAASKGQGPPPAASGAEPRAEATAQPPSKAEASSDRSGPVDPGKASVDSEPTFPLLEGTLIGAVLTNRLDGSSASPVNAMVTEPVYARDFQHVLIPRGSRLLGSATPVAQFGQQRLAVAFHRLVFPDGRFVSLDKPLALNQRGDAGLRDKVDQHYLQIFGASLAIGALAGLAQVNTGVALDQSWTDAYRQGVGSSVTQSSMRILDRFLNQLPTVTIREGHRLKVYLTSDMALPAYRDYFSDAVPHRQQSPQ